MCPIDVTSRVLPADQATITLMRSLDVKSWRSDWRSARKSHVIVKRDVRPLRAYRQFPKYLHISMEVMTSSLFQQVISELYVLRRIQDIYPNSLTSKTKDYGNMEHCGSECRPTNCPCRTIFSALNSKFSTILYKASHFNHTFPTIPPPVCPPINLFHIRHIAALLKTTHNTSCFSTNSSLSLPRDSL